MWQLSAGIWRASAALAGSALVGCTAADNVDGAAQTAYDVIVSVDYIPRDEGPVQPKDTTAGDSTLADIVAPNDTTGGDVGLSDVVASDTTPTDSSPTDAGSADVRDTTATDVKVPDTIVKQDAALLEDVTPTLGYRWVRISDDPNNPSLILCLPGTKATPGADIDAVEVLRAADHLAYASEVIGDLDKDPHGHGEPCQNVAGDEMAVIGVPDAGVGTGAVSLNAGSIIVAFDADTTFEVGDVLRVFEVSTADVGVPESYMVAISQTKTGPWVELGSFVGPADIDVQFPPP